MTSFMIAHFAELDAHNLAARGALAPFATTNEVGA
ncbi:hypothetical protein X747_31200 [Mesorhizobium sp. LNJC384A00]|nr:hypothetical protein X766_30480 [Mesorhizobium sp. LSJC255A00]ESX22762.1 hypothetical protein X765_30270 [Mesorhizobium sp. LSHC440B00]ESX30767.1 hypothetical protein X763_29525 [Mesorhizobium sp. LSHC432A00]ESX35839.1 hypothetical protein X764_25780 [Mesorhizobium sp. LSHC440A00]ESY32859.1 hypothetical protein X747_31200 [Mesorhizobium sp. LNJC384A00]